MAARAGMLGFAVLFWLSGAAALVVSMVTKQWFSRSALGIVVSNLNLFKTCTAGICIEQGERIRTCAFQVYALHQGFLKVCLNIPRSIRLDVGDIQQCWEVKSKSRLKSSF